MTTTWVRLCGLLVLIATAGSASAQQLAQGASLMAAADLPDSPGTTVLAAEPEATVPGAVEAPGLKGTVNGQRYHRIVRPGQAAPSLTVGDKLKLSVISRVSVIEVATTTYSAGISQLRDSRPHYGQDAGAFGERFGAIALKHTSQSFLSYGVYAAAFHEDPRYYVMGRDHKIVNRALYAATRLFITRNDAGNQTTNWAKLLGLSSANALTFTYYPDEDRTADAFAKNELSSLYGTVINNEIHEFIGDIKDLIFHHHK